MEKQDVLLPMWRKYYEAGVQAFQRGQFLGAEKLFQAAIQQAELHQIKDPLIIKCIDQLASIYQKQQKYIKAEPLYQRLLALQEERFGADHQDIILSLHNLANVFIAQAKYFEAEECYCKSINIIENNVGPGHLSLAVTLRKLAQIYSLQRMYKDAEPLLCRAIKILEGSTEADPSLRLRTLETYADLLHRTQRYSEAIQIETRIQKSRDKINYKTL